MSLTSDDDILGGEPRIGVRHVATRGIDTGQSPAHVADQFDISLSNVSEALSYYYAHLDELRELERENTEAFERVRESSLKPKETAR